MEDEEDIEFVYDEIFCSEGYYTIPTGLCPTSHRVLQEKLAMNEFL